MLAVVHLLTDISYSHSCSVVCIETLHLTVKLKIANYISLMLRHLLRQNCEYLRWIALLSNVIIRETLMMVLNF